MTVAWEEWRHLRLIFPWSLPPSHKQQVGRYLHSPLSLIADFVMIDREKHGYGKSLLCRCYLQYHMIAACPIYRASTWEMQLRIVFSSAYHYKSAGWKASVRVGHQSKPEQPQPHILYLLQSATNLDTLCWLPQFLNVPQFRAHSKTIYPAQLPRFSRMTSEYGQLTNSVVSRLVHLNGREESIHAFG